MLCKFITEEIYHLNYSWDQKQSSLFDQNIFLCLDADGSQLHVLLAQGETFDIVF